MTQAQSAPPGSAVRQGPVPRRAEKALVVFSFMLLTGPPRLRARDLTTALDSPFTLDPAALVQVVTWVGAALTIAYILMTYPRYWGMFRSLVRDRPVAAYLALALLAMASMLWSPSPLYTLFFAAKLVIGVTALALLTVHGRKARFDRPVRVMLAVCVLKLSVLILVFPVKAPLVVAYTSSSPLGWRLSGGPLLEDYGNSSLFLGMWFLAIGLFGESRKRRLRALAAYGFTWVTLLLGQGRTQILTGVFAFLIMLSLTPRSRSKQVLIGLGCAALLMVIAVGRLDTLTGIATRGGEGVSNLTGRTDAFDYLMPVWRQKPLLGWGYAAGTRAALLGFQKESGLGIGAGHDILSTTLVDLGVVGAIVVSGVFLTTWYQMGRLWRVTRALRQARVVVAYLSCITVQISISSGFGTGIEQHLPPFLVLLATTWAFRRELAISRAARRE